MKNLVKALFFIMFIAVAMPSQSMTTTTNTNTAKPLDAAEGQRLTNRLEEIKAMDKDNLSRPERRELRREVKAIKKTQDGGGVYISVGALILIIILLIILL